MDNQGLSFICSGLGEQVEDDNGVLTGYSKNDYCLDNLKDLQRFLRRDDPQRRDVFKQICKWNTVGRDIVPIIEFHQTDRNLVITAVKILVFLTMPVDPGSDDVAQQMEYLWDLKAAVTRNVTIAVVVSLLEDPLEHLEGNAFTEEDWKLVQLVLTLFRNILAIQGITLQQKASGSATQFLYLTDKFLELMFEENVMDLILVLTQHVDDPRGYFHQDSLLLLEIFHYIFEARDAELIARASKNGTKAGGDITTSVDSLRSIMEEEEEKRRSIRQRNLERHSQFSGTFTRVAMDGSKTLFNGNPASAFGDGLLKVHKVPRGPLKRIALDHRSLLLTKENILELLHTFLNQFLSGGYNVLMQSVCDDIKKERQDIQNADVIFFFQVSQFVLAFQRQKILAMQKQNMQFTMSGASLDGNLSDKISFDEDFCGPVAASINEAMFYLVISKWREAFEGLKETNDHKSLSVAGSLMKNMVYILHLVLKLLPEDSKESHTARVLLYKLFYDQTDQGMTLFLLNLFRSFDIHKQPKSYLADLLEVIHIVLQLMEKLQARGTLRVSRKSRKVRRTKKMSREVEPDKFKDEGTSLQNTDDQTNEAEKHTSELFSDTNMADKNPSESSIQKYGGPSKQALESDIPIIDTGISKDDSFPAHNDKEHNLNDVTYEAEDSSDGDQLPAINEVDFNVSKLVSTLANNAVIQNLCWLLKYYRSNSACTNHYIVSMLRRFCDDLELSPMLYQLSVLTTFYDIVSDQKISKSKDHANTIHFLTKFIRKMMKILKSQPLLFVEILFWKTRKECHCINADALMCDLVHLKKDIGSLDSERAGFSYQNSRSYKSIADSLGDDEVDNVVPHIFNSQGEESLFDTIPKDNVQKTRQSDYYDENRSEGISSGMPTQTTSRSRKLSMFSPDQETAIKNLYEKYKDDWSCSRLIAEALDSDGNISPVQVSCKLKQLGFKLPSRKRLTSSGMRSPVGEDEVGVLHDASINDAIPYNLNEANDSNGKTSRRRKRIHAFSKEQELEVKVLFERFKNEKKCSQLIANALGAENKYTATQVLQKLRQLGLVGPPVRRSSKAVKHSEVKETLNLEEQSDDEETLLTIKERSKRKNNEPLPQEAKVTSTSEHDTDDETLSTMFKSKRKKNEPLMQEGKVMSTLENDIHEETLSTMFEDIIKEQHGSDTSLKVRHEEPSASFNKNNETEMDNTNNNEEDMGILYQQENTDKELMDLEDSEDDLEAVVPRKGRGSRRNLKMVIDVEDDE